MTQGSQPYFTSEQSPERAASAKRRSTALASAPTFTIGLSASGCVHTQPSMIPPQSSSTTQRFASSTASSSSAQGSPPAPGAGSPLRSPLSEPSPSRRTLDPPHATNTASDTSPNAT